MKKLASRKDSRIIDLMIKYGPEGYGTYALLVEYLKERKAFRSVTDIRRIAYELHVNAEILRAIIEDFNLFEIIDGQITTKVAKRKTTETEEAAEIPPVTQCQSEPETVQDSGIPLEATQKREITVSSPEPQITSSSKRRARRKRRHDSLKI